MTESEIAQLTESELRNCLGRGDFHSESSSSIAQRLLRAFDSENEFMAKCERANLSASLDAKDAARRAENIANKANNWAMIATIMALIANVVAVIAVLR